MNCPKCETPAEDRHCMSHGCGWWKCVFCRLFFNTRGGQLPFHGVKF
ncbi:MAG: hypothetical protein JWO67_1279 [Streptosporangiaceae bacterium]|nr:hypothetical protein [Streptosporangiaceae bacterium]